MKIGFIGLGIMGRAMALNLIKGGHTVTVWARRAESMQPLLDAGAKAADGPAEAAQGNEIVISMVADAPDVAEVMRAVATAAEPGLVAVDMSTIAPAAARRIGEELAAVGIDFPNAGENIALSPDVETAHRMLLESPLHRENILNPKFSEIGIGVRPDARGGVYLVQEFIGP